MSWFAGFEPNVRAEAPLGGLTSYLLGGPARWLCEPGSVAELQAMLVRLREHEIPWRVIGSGANVLIGDAGYGGAVLRLRGDAFESVEFDGDVVNCGSGVDFPRLIRTCLRRDRVGLERLAGIPGTVGGLIRMNAGGKYAQIGEFVVDIRVIDEWGRESVRSAEQVGFRYRGTALDGGIIVSARLRLEAGDGRAALERHTEIWNEKFASQPPVARRTAGCVFKNPPAASAGALIDQVGLKGTRVGGAEISTQHANFILAHPNAKSQHVLDLIEMARQRVRDATGIELETEIEIW